MPNSAACEHIVACLLQTRPLLSQFWLPPHELRLRLEDRLATGCSNLPRDIIVSGETDNVSVYLVYETHIFVFTPFADIRNNVVLKEKYPLGFEPRGADWHCIPVEPDILKRLQLIKVLFVNPCVHERYPVPRLSLSIGILASYLRMKQLAEVRLIDMQTGATVEDVVQETLRVSPSLLGISISYGQQRLAMRILDRIQDLRLQGRINSLLVLGNSIPASFPREFISRYPDCIVATGEGEYTVSALVEYLRGTRRLDQVPGIVFRPTAANSSHTHPHEALPLATLSTRRGTALPDLVATEKQSVRLDEIPMPALDTVPDLARCGFVLSAEFSRGCQWSACTFCPRWHKASHRKTVPTVEVLRHFARFRQLCDRFDLPKDLFLVDEEFVGDSPDGSETARIKAIADELIDLNLQMNFSPAARVDQVYDRKMSRQWHLERMSMWRRCRKAGLTRLFLGIESGSTRQLQRFGKGVTPEDSVMAIRILSALDIPLRFGFITFDQLMVGLDDLRETIHFLERTDALVRPVDCDHQDFERLFERLHDPEFVREHSAALPIFTGVSYMLTTLEVLINCPYHKQIVAAERRYGKKLILDTDHLDTNMGSIHVAFLDDIIGDLSVSCQEWIKRNFALAYIVKSVNVTNPANKQCLMDWMTDYRSLSLQLLKSMVSAVDIQIPLLSEKCPERQPQQFFERRCGYDRSRRTMRECLEEFDRRLRVKNQEIRRLLGTGALADSADRQLAAVLDRWEAQSGKWDPINEH